MGEFKDKHGKTKVGTILSQITKDIPELGIEVLDVIASPNPIGAAFNKLKSKLSSFSDLGERFLGDLNSLSENDLKLFESSLLDTQNARNNETARDISEHAGWLSKNIHEIIAIAVVGGWMFTWFYKPEINPLDIKDMVVLILGYLYGRTKPQS